MTKIMTKGIDYPGIAVVFFCHDGAGRYIMNKRSANARDEHGCWDVGGGGVKKGEMLEDALRREVKEEVGLDITNIVYVTSLATVHGDGNPSLVISCLADYQSGEVRLMPDETDDFKWVTLEEAVNFQLIDGIYDELKMAEDLRKGTKTEWQRA